MKKIILGLLLFPLFYYFFVYTPRCERKLEEAAHVFLVACQTSCIIDPTQDSRTLGWNKEPYHTNEQPSFYKNGMEYTASKDRFEISYHIATDTYLIAKGGKNLAFSIEYISE